MAKLPLEVLDLRQTSTSDLRSAIDEANRVQDEFSFSLLDESYSKTMWLHVRSDTHTGELLDSLQNKKREWRGYHPFILCILDSPIHSDRWGNIFSSRRAEKGLAIVTSAEVEVVIVPTGKMASYFVYELAVHTLAFVVGGREHHHQVRGCVFDFNEDKKAIIDSMRAGSLCDECRTWFLENGQDLSDEQLSAFVALLQLCSRLLEEEPEVAQADKPRVFVASSVEGLNIARAIQSEFQYDYYVEIWNQSDVFGLGGTTIEALEKAVKTYQYGIFVFTPDDMIESRGSQAPVPRDNVIFEAGLFIGKLGRFRSFLVHPRNIQIQLPSDLLGVTTASYDGQSPSVDAAVGPACRKIRKAIEKTG